MRQVAADIPGNEACCLSAGGRSGGGDGGALCFAALPVKQTKVERTVRIVLCCHVRLMVKRSQLTEMSNKPILTPTL